MKKNVLTIIAGILLVIYALANFGASFGQFAKGKAVGETASLVSGFGQMAGNMKSAAQIEKKGFAATLVLYGIAVFILLTAILNLTAAIGLFSPQTWTFNVVTLSAICGILVEIQDTAEDGFGIGKLIFFAINILAFIAVYSAKKEQELLTE